MPEAVPFDVREDVTAALGRLAAAGVSMRVPMGDIAGHLADTTEDRFETGRDPLGVPWKPSQRALATGDKTLVESGDLVGSIQPSWGDDFAAAGSEASGGAAVYAAIHQFGGTIRPKAKKALAFNGRVVAQVVIPARPYVGFTDENADYAVETLAAHLDAALAGTGGGAAA